MAEPVNIKITIDEATTESTEDDEGGGIGEGQGYHKETSNIQIDQNSKNSNTGAAQLTGKHSQIDGNGNRSSKVVSKDQKPNGSVKNNNVKHLKVNNSSRRRHRSRDDTPLLDEKV